jgi:hypothetical protein
MASQRRLHSRLTSVERALQQRRSSPEEQQRAANARWWHEWFAAGQRLLAAVSAEQTAAVMGVLESWVLQQSRDAPPCPGLVSWVHHLAGDRGFVPAKIAPEVIATYLTDARAQPAHDCADCGMEVPVRPPVVDARSFGPNGVYRAAAEAAVYYFPVCPHCGGQTGQLAYWQKHGGPPERPLQTG